jgi:tetratricopeptide (TPR) repeat protein
LFNDLYLGEAYWRLGRLAEATETLQNVADLGERTGFRYYRGAALRLLGEVTAAADRTPDGLSRAVAHFEQSITLLSDIGAENELALAHAGYGRLRRDYGDKDAARQHLSAAKEIFDRLGTLGEADQVRKDIATLT